MQGHGGLADLEIGRRFFDRSQPHHRDEGAQLSRRHSLPFYPALPGPIFGTPEAQIVRPLRSLASHANGVRVAVAIRLPVSN
ncbi:hypothetical protein Rhe02_58480 [Rhizocola hellebori]|uniref:Uncharacterized protein n=1 Tax=Rhizocola hellebori TaxID=1392758 RepID=A0A8J3VJ69_9ACTN|nr:hypothetical protein Rhe02_58480 [Rhizocola hellebori]